VREPLALILAAILITVAVGWTLAGGELFCDDRWHWPYAEFSGYDDCTFTTWC